MSRTGISGYDGPYLSVLNEVVRLFQLIQIKKDNSGYWPTTELRHSETCSFSCMVDNNDNDSFEVTVNPFESFRLRPSVHPAPEKILVVADIEGNFNALYSLLIRHHVIDDKCNWIFQKNSLVILGDLVDKGDNTTQCLWLVYKLERQARKHRGSVHYILGNHEVMDLECDLRYVNEKYFGVERTITGNNNPVKAHVEFMRTNNFLVNWMMSKNSIELIGNNVFVHGGISPQLLARKISMQGINRYVHHYLKHHVISKKARITELIAGELGPLWYRGLVTANSHYDKISESSVDQVLELYNASRIIVGHTIVDNVSDDFHGKVIRTDVMHSQKKYSDLSQGLLIEGENYYRIYGSGRKEYMPLLESNLFLKRMSLNVLG